MMGSKYRLNSGLPPLPVNHITQVMNITIDQDSISSLVRLRPGRKRRPRNPTMASANATSNPMTGHICAANAPDQMSTKAASTKHSISMERVLRITLRWPQSSPHPGARSAKLSVPRSPAGPQDHAAAAVYPPAVQLPALSDRVPTRCQAQCLDD